MDVVHGRHGDCSPRGLRDRLPLSGPVERQTEKMATMIQNGTDVITFLKSQHEQIKALFSEVKAARGERRAKAFYALRRLLAVHETAEEEIVHPVARRKLSNGEAIVAARLQEEREAKSTLAALEKLDLDSDTFAVNFMEFESSVIEHAEAEEREEFAQLATELDPQQLVRMRRAAELAEAVAPTRPHAGVESAAANFIAGPFASMVDRTRDALTGKA